MATITNSDTYYHNTTLLLHCNGYVGTGGVVNLLDDSQFNSLITTNNNFNNNLLFGNNFLNKYQNINISAFSTDKPITSSTTSNSIVFNGTDNLIKYNGPQFDIFSNDGTCEFFFKPISLNNGEDITLLHITGYFSTPIQYKYEIKVSYVYNSSLHNAVFYITLIYENQVIPVLPYTFVLNTTDWFYFALSQTDRLYNFYLGNINSPLATLIASYQGIQNFRTYVPSVIVLGAKYDNDNNNSEFYTGYMSEIRFTKGVSRYSDFTIPIPTETFPNYLLIQ
jgi:hypothetical protein